MAAECACPFRLPYRSPPSGTRRVRAEGSTICIAQAIGLGLGRDNFKTFWAEGPIDACPPGPLPQFTCRDLGRDGPPAVSQPCRLGYANCWTFGPRWMAAECACPFRLPYRSPPSGTRRVRAEGSTICIAQAIGLGLGHDKFKTFWAEGPIDACPPGPLPQFTCRDLGRDGPPADTQPCRLGDANCWTFGPQWLLAECACPFRLPYRSPPSGTRRVRAEGSTICIAQAIGLGLGRDNFKTFRAEGPIDACPPGPLPQFTCRDLGRDGPPAVTQPCRLGYANCWTFGPRWLLANRCLPPPPAGLGCSPNRAAGVAAQPVDRPMKSPKTDDCPALRNPNNRYPADNCYR